MTEGFRAEQEKYAFPIPDGLPDALPAVRTTPNVGTNVSCIFGEAALAVLDLSEEELELLEALRIVPDSLLSKYMSEDAVRTLTQSKQELIARSNACGQSIETLVRTRVRKISTDKAQTLLKLSVAERKAGKNMSLFCGFCKGLRSRFASLDSAQTAELEVFFDRTEAVLRRLLSIESLEIAADMLFGEDYNEANTQKLYACFSLLRAQEHSPEISRAQQESAHLRNFYRTANIEELSAAGGTRQLLQKMLGNASHSAWRATLADLDIYRYLLGLDTSRDLNESEMLELMYAHLHDTLVRNLSVTPAELALQSLLTERTESISGCLLLGGMIGSYLWRFESSGHASLLYGVSESFRTLGRIAHMFGVRSGPVYLDLAQLCVQNMPYLSAQETAAAQTAQERIEEAANICDDNDSVRGWSYLDSKKPWLPSRHRASLNFSGPFSIARSDIVLASLRSSELWRNLKWAGIDVDSLSEEDLRQGCDAINSTAGVGSALHSSIDDRLVKCLVENAKNNPEQNAAFIVAFLGLSSMPKPLYFNREIEEEIVELKAPNTDPAEIDINSDEEWPDLEL